LLEEAGISRWNFDMGRDKLVSETTTVTKKESAIKVVHAPTHANAN